jgi:hypothetical protein
MRLKSYSFNNNYIRLIKRSSKCQCGNDYGKLGIATNQSFCETDVTSGNVNEYTSDNDNYNKVYEVKSKILI